MNTYKVHAVEGQPVEHLDGHKQAKLSEEHDPIGVQLVLENCHRKACLQHRDPRPFVQVLH